MGGATDPERDVCLKLPSGQGRPARATESPSGRRLCCVRGSWVAGGLDGPRRAAVGKMRPLGALNGRATDPEGPGPT